MLTVGDKFPEFNKEATISLEPGKEFKSVTLDDLKGKWTVLFWYPKDFTFICPTEIIEFNNQYEKFVELGANLYGASTDTEEVHLAWRMNDPRLKEIKFPLLADTSKSLSEELGILQPSKVAYRATFIIDPEGVIQWVNVNNDGTGRNVAEILRALEATQNPGLTGCNWESGQATL